MVIAIYYALYDDVQNVVIMKVGIDYVDSISDRVIIEVYCDHYVVNSNFEAGVCLKHFNVINDDF